MLSLAMATRVGGGDPHSERQRVEQVCPASVQLTSGGPLTTMKDLAAGMSIDL